MKHKIVKGSKAKNYDKKNKKVIILLIVFIVIALATTAFYTDKNISKIVDKNQTIEVSMVSSQSFDVNEKNDLTGLPISNELKNRRPIAVMINNIEQAQPLLGVSKSDVMYECLVEGAITRIMALFKSNLKDIPMIGSVRSSRPYFINIAKGHGAIYCHIGGSTEALTMLSNGVIDSFDLGSYSNMMWRDDNRRNNLGYEHSAVTSGERLINGIMSTEVSLDYKNENLNKQKFGEDSQVLKGEPCNKLKATFSYYKNTEFEYLANSLEYKVSQFGAAQMDGSAGTQNTEKNILALYIDTHPIENSILQEMVLTGSGSGYYVANGKIIKIKWERSGLTANFNYYLETGEPLIMLPGRTYICCVPLNGNIEYS